jgi:tRNA(Ile)-lysidine synthase
MANVDPTYERSTAVKLTEQAPSVDDLLERCTFPDKDEDLHCAVSGGADSAALLILARAAGCAVTAHHVDHGLRPGSASEAQVVRDLAARFGAEFVAHRADITPGSNLEARARQARFACLPDKVATGHTLDDRAETMLINLLRGAARTGLSPLSDPQRHPIVALRRLETQALCRSLGVSVVVDPSNDDPAFVRNRVRDRQADLLGSEDEFLDSLAAEIDPTDAKAVALAPTVLARRALRMFITSEWPRDHPPAVDSVDRVLEVARGIAVSCELEGGHRVHRTNQRLRLESPLGNEKRQ